MFSFFFLASTMTELFRPMFTGIIDCQRDTLLSHVVLCFIKAVSIVGKIPAAVGDVEARIIKI